MVKSAKRHHNFAILGLLVVVVEDGDRDRDGGGCGGAIVFWGIFVQRKNKDFRS